MQSKILRGFWLFFFVALRSNWKVIVLVYGFPELQHAVYLFSYLCNVFTESLASTAFGGYNLNLGWSRLITSAYGMHFRCKQLEFVTHKSIVRNGIFGEGVGGGCILATGPKKWLVCCFFSESALNYCNAHMLPSAEPRYSVQSADPRAVFWEKYW